MTDTPENHTIKLLQEIRGEMREQFAEMREQFDDVNTRIDGVTHILTLIAGHQYALEARVEAIEDADTTEA